MLTGSAGQTDCLCMHAVLMLCDALFVWYCYFETSRDALAWLREWDVDFEMRRLLVACVLVPPAFSCVRCTVFDPYDRLD